MPDTLIVLIGPTGVGKTELSLSIAESFFTFSFTFKTLIFKGFSPNNIFISSPGFTSYDALTVRPFIQTYDAYSATVGEDICSTGERVTLDNGEVKRRFLP